MITVAILVNGHPIYARSAVRQESGNRKGKISSYKLDTGKIIKHAYNDGAVALIKKMVDSIEDVKLLENEINVDPGLLKTIQMIKALEEERTKKDVRKR